MVSSSQIRSQNTSPPIKQTKTKTDLPRSLFLLYFEWQASICCPGWLLLTVFVSCVLDELSFCEAIFCSNTEECSSVLVLRFAACSLAFLACILFSTLTERIDLLSWPWTYECYLIKTFKVAMEINSGVWIQEVSDSISASKITLQHENVVYLMKVENCKV